MVMERCYSRCWLCGVDYDDDEKLIVRHVSCLSYFYCNKTYAVPVLQKQVCVTHVNLGYGH